MVYPASSCASRASGSGRPAWRRDLRIVLFIDLIIDFPVRRSLLYYIIIVYYCFLRIVLFVYLFVYIIYIIYRSVFYLFIFRGSGVPAFSYARVREKGAGPKTVPEAGVEKVNAEGETSV